MLSFENAPPFSAPLRFFLTAPLFAVLAGLLLVIEGPVVFASRWTPGALAATHLRLPPVVVQGQPVKVVTRGGGIQVTNDGTALSTAGDGQPAQVRLSSGQVLRGTARSGGVVEVTLP